MKKTIFALVSIVFVTVLHAQTKIFKEVGEEISTQMKEITQDNALVGYLAFTKLEKASADSFNYRITIMDENLNDIGTVNFRQEKIELQGVALENDVLCLGYVQNSTKAIVTNKDARNAYKNGIEGHVLVQFISLAGKVLRTFTTKVDLIAAVTQAGGAFSMKMDVDFYLKYGMQVRNMAKTGFCVFYGDANRKDILLFDMDGNKIRDRRVTVDATNYFLLASNPNYYLLTKNNDEAPEGGFRISTYSIKDSTAEYKYDLKDKQGDQLKVLSFDNDPTTGKAFLAGCIINADRTKDFITAKDFSRDPYLGVFTLNLGNTNKDIQANYSYWYNGKIPGITGDGLWADKSFYVRYALAFRDYKGNTVFAGTAMEEKKLLGIAKYRLSDAVFVFQGDGGKLKLDNNIPCDQSKYFGPASSLSDLDKKSFYRVTNSDSKSNYVIIDDEYNTYIYNVNSQKIMRTIQHKEGSLRTGVYPAKEGHIMVAEYNKRQKYTRFSIEAL
jgi:hypothetical protein